MYIHMCVCHKSNKESFRRKLVNSKELGKDASQDSFGDFRGPRGFRRVGRSRQAESLRGVAKTVSFTHHIFASHGQPMQRDRLKKGV